MLNDIFYKTFTNISKETYVYARNKTMAVMFTVIPFSYALFWEARRASRLMYAHQVRRLYSDNTYGLPYYGRTFGYETDYTIETGLKDGDIVLLGDDIKSKHILSAIFNCILKYLTMLNWDKIGIIMHRFGQAYVVELSGMGQIIWTRYHDRVYQTGAAGSVAIRRLQCTAAQRRAVVDAVRSVHIRTRRSPNYKWRTLIVEFGRGRWNKHLFKNLPEYFTSKFNCQAFAVQSCRAFDMLEDLINIFGEDLKKANSANIERAKQILDRLIFNELETFNNERKIKFIEKSVTYRAGRMLHDWMPNWLTPPGFVAAIYQIAGVLPLFPPPQFYTMADFIVMQGLVASPGGKVWSGTGPLSIMPSLSPMFVVRNGPLDETVEAKKVVNNFGHRSWDITSNAVILQTR
eukprot:GHVL01025139.1.p1 GENE.GHVL01025139.1~~GHVL01025139.1.p1  ORF type:complete len:404 (-),score=43.67 GHVL01025139.1:25-1236(-)